MTAGLAGVGAPDLPALVSRAQRLGPLRCSALPPGPRPEVPAGVAAWLVTAVDEWWDELGRPDPFTVVEVGAGDGARAAAVLAAGPACARALRYVLVEPDRARRTAQALAVALEEPNEVLGPLQRPGDALDDEADIEAGRGPLLTSLGDMPALAGVDVLVAVGCLSCLPADHFVTDGTGWSEVRLAVTADGADLYPLLVPVEPDDVAGLEAVAATGGASDGRVVLQRAACRWLGDVLATMGKGMVVVVDAPALSVSQLDRVRPATAVLADERLSPLQAGCWDLRSKSSSTAGGIPS